MVSLLLDGVSLDHETGPALQHVTLRVDDGEALAVLGQSGSGKTSLLRIIAGLETPSTGDVLFDGTRMNEVDPAARDLAMVFQDGALFPHMTVGGNVSFPLVVRQTRPREIVRRVEAETRAKGIARLLDRHPNQLSAGEQHLTQMARAMIRRPHVLLIDEPFARLDPVSKSRMRAELRAIQQGYAVTTVYATHDYEDAMGMADRVAVLEKGKILQVGVPEEIYEHPRHVSVASIVGSPPMNMFEGIASGGIVKVGELEMPGGEGIEGDVLVGVRPHHWALAEDGIPGQVGRIYRYGRGSFAKVDTVLGEITVRFDDELPTEATSVGLHPLRFHVFDKATGRAV